MSSTVQGLLEEVAWSGFRAHKATDSFGDTAALLSLLFLFAATSCCCLSEVRDEPEGIKFMNK